MSGTVPILKDNGAQCEWFTARELTTLNLPEIPATERAVQLSAKRCDWQSTSLARKRKGRGGGWEYHIDLLPEAARADLDKRVALQELERSKAVLHENPQLPAVPGVRTCKAPNARQTRVMQARGVVLGEVDRRTIVHDLSFKKAADQMLRDVKLFAAGQLTSDAGHHLQADYEPLCDAVRLASGQTRDSATLSIRVLYKWKSQLASGGVRALAPQTGRPRLKLGDYPWLNGYLKFYARPTKPTMKHALRLYTESLDDPSGAPNYDMVLRIIRKLGNVDRHRGREGALTLKSRMAYFSRSTDDLMPTSIYTADGKTFDAEVAHMLTGQPFKPEITSVLDVKTRKCVGFSVSLKENVIAVCDALRVSCCASGIPAIFYVDRGPGYKNKTFDGDVSGMMGRLGITKMHSLPYNSQARGIIERFHGTVWNPLAQELPTYLGAPMDKEASQKAHKATRKHIKEHGHSRLLLSWDEFIGRCEQAVERYNNTPHSSLPKWPDPESVLISMQN